MQNSYIIIIIIITIIITTIVIMMARNYFRPRSAFDLLENKFGRSEENLKGGRGEPGLNGQNSPLSLETFNTADEVNEDVFENPIHRHAGGYSSFRKDKGRQISAAEGAVQSGEIDDTM
nr:hypothetical protein BaRGS_015842 [Batillaria attramentaria]